MRERGSERESERREREREREGGGGERIKTEAELRDIVKMESTNYILFRC